MGRIITVQKLLHSRGRRTSERTLKGEGEVRERERERGGGGGGEREIIFVVETIEYCNIGFYLSKYHIGRDIYIYIIFIYLYLQHSQSKQYNQHLVYQTFQHWQRYIYIYNIYLFIYTCSTTSRNNIINTLFIKHFNIGRGQLRARDTCPNFTSTFT